MNLLVIERVQGQGGKVDGINVSLVRQSENHQLPEHSHKGLQVV